MQKMLVKLEQRIKWPL